MSPDSFWGSTLAEASSFLRGKRDQDKQLWNHTSSLMALYAQSKSKRGSNITPAKFHPYEQLNQKYNQKTKEEMLAKFKNF